MSLPFKGAFKQGATGKDVAGVKRTLRYELGHKRVTTSNRFGAEATAALRIFQRNHGLVVDGIYGRATHVKLEPHMRGYGRWLYAHARLRAHPRQIPALPRFWPPGVFWLVYGPMATRWGIQAALVPQVEAICAEFGLHVTDGWGTHPPHAYRSDHRVGLAVDLAGPYSQMVACNLWADGLRPSIFRWVGGPAHDADGIEPGHYNHVHISWRRIKPTTIFGTSRFKALA